MNCPCCSNSISAACPILRPNCTFFRWCSRAVADRNSLVSRSSTCSGSVKRRTSFYCQWTAICSIPALETNCRRKEKQMFGLCSHGAKHHSIGASHDTPVATELAQRWSPILGSSAPLGTFHLHVSPRCWRRFCVWCWVLVFVVGWCFPALVLRVLLCFFPRLCTIRSVICLKS